jgi:Uma2 family endonuclease
MASTPTIPLAARVTYEEFLAQYDGLHAEWEDGEVIARAPASRCHQAISGFLFNAISLYVETHALGEVFYAEFQMRLRAHKTGREPDILFVATQNLARVQPNYLDGPADLAIEIISPESIRRDRETKFREYETAGVGEYWIIDPLEQTATFYQRTLEGRYQNIGIDTEGRYFSRALPGLWLQPDWLWQTPLPPTLGIIKQWGLV